MKLEQQIVGLREKRGLTQRQLAKLLGTSQPYVAKLESGRMKNLGVKTLVKCAQALGASVSIRMDSVAALPLGRRLATTESRVEATVWLSLTQMAELFGRDKSVISR